MKRMCAERMPLVHTVGPERLVVPSHRLRHGMYLETNASTHFLTSHRSMNTQFMNANDSVLSSPPLPGPDGQEPVGPGSKPRTPCSILSRQPLRQKVRQPSIRFCRCRNHASRLTTATKLPKCVSKYLVSIKMSWCLPSLVASRSLPISRRRHFSSVIPIPQRKEYGLIYHPPKAILQQRRIR